MDDNRISKLYFMMVMGAWLSAGSKFLRGMRSLDHIRGGKSIPHRTPKGASSTPVQCCRCGYGGSSEPLKVAWEQVKKVNGIKVRTKYYIHESCEH